MVTDSDFLVSDYHSIQLKDIRHVWYFETILEHILFSFVTCSPAMRHMFLREFVVFRKTWRSGSVWYSSLLVYDG